MFLKLVLVSTILFFCSGQLFEDTLNLQQNELFTLDLTKYYEFTASSFDFPVGVPSDQIKQPYQELSTESPGSYIIAAGFFQNNKDDKQILGYKTILSADSKSMDVQIVYYNIKIVSGVITRTELGNYMLLTSISISTSLKLSASFYSSSSGFVAYQNDNVQGVLHFTYQITGLQIQQLDNKLKIINQITIRKSDNVIYIVYSSIDYIGLIKYEEGTNNLQQIDKYSLENRVCKNTVTDSSRNLISIDNQSNILYRFNVNFSSEKLTISQITLPNFTQFYNAQNILKVDGNNHLLILTKVDSGSVFIKLQVLQSIEDGLIQIISIKQSAVYLKGTLIPLNNNILFNADNESFNWMSINKSQIIFQKIQYTKMRYYVDPLETISNQIIFQTASVNDQGITVNSIQPILLQSPAIIIKGQNQKLSIFVYQTELQYTLNILITINITNNPITSISSKQISIKHLISSTKNDQYYFSLEKYITGSNITPIVTISQNNYISNVKVSQIIDLKSSQSLFIDGVQQVYQTDGIIASVIINKKSENIYLISAATPTEDSASNGSVILYSSALQLPSPVGIIDNYGTFVLEQDISSLDQIIYIPFILKNQLVYNTLKTSSNALNYKFTSDTLNNILFIMLNKEITQINYAYSNKSNGELLIISKTIISLDASSYTDLICIQGNLFISNSLTITVYNYLLNHLSENSLQVPSLVADINKQQIYLFSHTFIIIVIDNQKLSISQYSYGDFLTKTAIFQRNLIKDQSLSSSNQKVSVIPKRNEIEYLFVSTSIQSQYSIFRINNSFSQNQLYATASIQAESKFLQKKIIPSQESQPSSEEITPTSKLQSNIPVFNSNYICTISSQVTCSKILEHTSLVLNSNISESDFNSNLSFKSSVTLSFESQSQQLELYFIRDGQTKFGVINLQADALTNLKSEVSKSNFIAGTKYFFNDRSIFNACVTEWTGLSSQISILNRINSVESSTSYTVFTILYNLKVQVSSKLITIGDTLLSLKSDFEGCFVLDDSASKKMIDSSSFSNDIYVLCDSTIYTYTIQFTTNPDGKITKASLLSQFSESFDPYIYLSDLRKIIKIDNVLWAFNTLGKRKYKILKRQNSSQFTIQSEYIGLNSVMSIYAIYSEKLELAFFRNGIINLKNMKDNSNVQYQIINLKYLLQHTNILISEDEEILSIFQYSDTEFLIQFTNSFIYDIAFACDSSQQLTISRSSLYYHRDAFETLQYGIRGKKYSLLIGYNNQNDLIVSLYNNQNALQSQFIIESALKINQKSPSINKIYVTSATEINDNEFSLYYSNGGMSSLTVSENVGIQFLQDKELYHSSSVMIYPQPLSNSKYWVEIPIKTKFDEEISETNKSIINSSIILILLVNCIFFV